MRQLSLADARQLLQLGYVRTFAAGKPITVRHASSPLLSKHNEFFMVASGIVRLEVVGETPSGGAGTRSRSTTMSTSDHTGFYTAGDFINSLGHATDSYALGAAPFKSNDDSRNVTWLGWLAFGDGFHNAHHAFPRSARCGLLRGEIDISWMFIHVCERLGLAHDVYTPPVDKVVDRLHDRSTVLARDLEKQRALHPPPVEKVPHAA